MSADRRASWNDGLATSSILQAFTRPWAGSAPADFDQEVREWLSTARQPTMGVLDKENVIGSTAEYTFLDGALVGGPGILGPINRDDADGDFVHTASAQGSMTEAEERGWTVVSRKDGSKPVVGSETR